MSKIEWTNRTWNPVTGCTPISPGCENCYAKKMAIRLRGRFGYPEDNPFDITYHSNVLYYPFHWKKPQRIFVCSMGDIFHKDVEFKHIRMIEFAIRKNPQHRFMMLTKRPNIMNEKLVYFEPLPDNLWIGVSVENQISADYRIPVLQSIPHKNKFLSCEPLLEPVKLDLVDIGWVIVGGETGHRARPMHPNWALSIRDQCREAKVPFFFKSTGTFSIGKKDLCLNIGREFNENNDDIQEWTTICSSERKSIGKNRYTFQMSDGIYKVEKKKVHTLDGKFYHEFPEELCL